MKRILLAALLLPAWVLAQPIPTLSLTGGRYALELPYLDLGSGSARTAWRARLQSGDLAVFEVEAGSVAQQALQGSGSSAARLEGGPGAYRLQLPYLEFTRDGQTRAFRATLQSPDLARFQVEAASVAELGLYPAAPGGLQLSEQSVQTVGAQRFGSSTQLLLSWQAPGALPAQYEIEALDASGSVLRFQAGAVATQALLSGLRAATAYQVTLRACADAACSRSRSASVSASTPTEFWQLQGSGNTVAGLLQPVSDGNARLSATRFGPEAGVSANTVQFYYGPRGFSGLAVASSAAGSYQSFTSLAASSGVRSPGSSGNPIQSIMTGQGVPLGGTLGAKVRLFFESNDADGRTRIYWVDSVDGYAGRDFHSGAATQCSSPADYAAGGPCAATLVIGVEGDGAFANAKLRAARQQKLAWPTQDDWRWRGEAGSFMVFTVDAISGCSTASHNHGYAVWDGSRFQVQYEAAGCPKLFKSMQAAVPMHLGGARYKLYFGDPSVTSGRLQGSGLPFVGPKKLLYADGALSGAAGTVEFEDWEPIAQARGLVFLWPNGELLDERAEGYIDDFHFLAPAGNLAQQLGYLSITDGVVVPFAALAVLLNP
ncbi:fibronectin type III domain-containing protein [Inhella proteolytica]|uniref:Fibronectin type III domain-containing protein n=1 Tax=Inhella proteolytica TaxID=2795029 RepID=A0A931J2L4_9BURK|nr:fibronectin type III domain-containing protein [Inhella proteolytica]MBH9577015.1 fibronectin type III domain-containing protein [Inhella proteolytica]